LSEANPFSSEAVEVGGLDDGMASAAQRVVAPVVGVEHEDIEGLGLGVCRWKDCGRDE